MFKPLKVECLKQLHTFATSYTLRHVELQKRPFLLSDAVPRRQYLLEVLCCRMCQSCLYTARTAQAMTYGLAHPHRSDATSFRSSVLPRGAYGEIRPELENFTSVIWQSVKVSKEVFHVGHFSAQLVCPGSFRSSKSRWPLRPTTMRANALAMSRCVLKHARKRPRLQPVTCVTKRYRFDPSYERCAVQQQR